MTTTKKPKNAELEILLKKHKTRESLGLLFLEKQQLFAQYENEYFQKESEQIKKLEKMRELAWSPNDVTWKERHEDCSQALEETREMLKQCYIDLEKERSLAYWGDGKITWKETADGLQKHVNGYIDENQKLRAELEKERSLVFDAQGKARDLSQDVDRLQELANKRGADNSNLNKSIHAEREKVRVLEAEKKEALKAYWAEKNKVVNFQDSLKATEDAAIEELENCEKAINDKNIELQAWKISCLNLNKTWSDRLKKADELYTKLEHETEVLRENRNEWQEDFRRAEAEADRLGIKLKELKNPLVYGSEPKDKDSNQDNKPASIECGPWQWQEINGKKTYSTTYDQRTSSSSTKEQMIKRVESFIEKHKEARMFSILESPIELSFKKVQSSPYTHIRVSLPDSGPQKFPVDTADGIHPSFGSFENVGMIPTAETSNYWRLFSYALIVFCVGLAIVLAGNL